MDSPENITGSTTHEHKLTDYQSNDKEDYCLENETCSSHVQDLDESKKCLDIKSIFTDGEKAKLISFPEKQTFLESSTSSIGVRSSFGNSHHDVPMYSCESVTYDELPPGVDIEILERMVQGDMPIGNENYSKSCEDVYILPFRKNSLVVELPPSRCLSEELLPNYTVTNQQRYHVQLRKGKLAGFSALLPGERRKQSSFRPLHSFSRTTVKKDTKPKVPFEPTVPAEKKKSKFTTEQKLVILCLCLVNLTSFLSMSIIAPFFPKEAAKKGMREAVSGFVFSIYALIVMLTSPLFGKLIPITGTHFLFLGGVFFSGGCNILFGFLNLIPDDLTFAVFCFVVRAFEALGAAAFCTASCTIIIDMFPDDIGTVFGFTETCIGIGMSLGPAIGGFLYSVGGFFLPFCTLGVFTVFTVPVCWFLLKPVENVFCEEKPTVSYTKLLSLPHVLVLCAIIMVSSQAQGFLDPTLEPHMRQYNIGSDTVGLLFLLVSASYAIFSPIIGWVAGKMENTYPIMVFGLLIMTVSLLLIGPAPFIPIKGSFWLSTITLVIIGMTFAMAFIPTFESILDAALTGGFEDDLGTYSIVAGLWNSVYSLGEVTGPALGGILADLLSFPYASSIMAACSILVCFVTIIAWINPSDWFGPLTEAPDEVDSKNDSCDDTKKDGLCNDSTHLLSNNPSTYGTCKKPV